MIERALEMGKEGVMGVLVGNDAGKCKPGGK
jgi:hypothetical protein